MDQILKCIEVSKSFGQVKAVSRLSVTLEAGQTLSLLGPSGCGKTTVLRLIAGFISPDEGVIEIGGNTVSGYRKFVPPEKRKVGIVFQDYALFPHLNVYKNIIFGVRKSEERYNVQKFISLLGLEGLEERMPSELSGGQQQRVAIARALVPRPHVLLLDEPFSNLDNNLRLAVREEIRDVLRSTGISVIFVTHDQEEAFYMGDKVAVMRHGSLEQFGSPNEIYHFPYSKFVAKFVGIADFLPVDVKNGVGITGLGEVTLPGDLMHTEGVELMVRPDDVVIGNSINTNATVISAAFQGDNYLYRISLDSGEVIHCTQHHTVRIKHGRRVNVMLAEHHNPPFFSRGYRVE